MTLQEVMQYAMAHARVLQDLGGTLLRAPRRCHDLRRGRRGNRPAIRAGSRPGAFDAQLNSSLLFQKNLQEYNNQQIGANGFYEQTFDNFQAQISKRSVTGDQFTVQHTVDWDSDNYLSNQFRGGNWDTSTEAQVRHPFLQGGGVDFNRIAGPGARPGVYNGVLVARMKTDIGLADFQIGLRDYVSNLENAYWDLYFAYRDLDTKIKARDDALDTGGTSTPCTRPTAAAARPTRRPRPANSTSSSRKTCNNALVGRRLGRNADKQRQHAGHVPRPAGRAGRGTQAAIADGAAARPTAA